MDLKDTEHKYYNGMNLKIPEAQGSGYLRHHLEFWRIDLAMAREAQLGPGQLVSYRYRLLEHIIR